MVRRYGAAESMSVDLNGDSVPDFVPGETLFRLRLLYADRLWIPQRLGWQQYAPTTSRVNSPSYEKLYGRDPDRASRWRIRRDITYYPSEFSKIRLPVQFRPPRCPAGSVYRRYGLALRRDHSIWLQFEFLLGTHAAHKF